MKRNTIYAIACLFSMVGTFASLSGCRQKTESVQQQETGKIAWPEVTRETKPWTRWWWFGSAVTETGLTVALESYEKAGLGGVEITPIYGVRGTEDQFITYLSPDWMEKLTYTLKEAGRLGLGVDLANASGWPFGGPWVSEEIASKGMYSHIYHLSGGQMLDEKIEFRQKPLVRTQGRKKITIDDVKEPVTTNDNLQECAFDQVRYEKMLPLIIVTAGKKGEQGLSETIDLTDKVVDGRLEWTAPEGEWVICALFQGDHGKMVERAGPGGEGYVIDHFSSEALRQYLDQFDKAFAGYDLEGLRYYFNDSYEVDDAVGEADWTPDLFSAFKAMHRYDLKAYIPALLGQDNEEINSRIRYDYRATISELLLREYTLQWQQWAEKQGKGIRNQAHGSPANVLDLYAASDIPEIEGNDPVNLKSASSAAHVTGKKLVSSEACTWLDEHFESTLGQAKEALDGFLLAGINHNFYHGTAYSPEEAAWPGWLFYAAVHFTPANSFWTDFAALNAYVTRAQSFLQAGRPANDVLLYFPIADAWSERGRALLQHLDTGNFFDGTNLKACGSYLLQNGYAWDAISDKQLLDVAYVNSALFTGGNAYRTILVPETQYMPLPTWEKLLELANNGACILLHKGLPADIPGWADLQQNKARMEALKTKLTFTENEQLHIAAYGKGKMVYADDLTALLAYARVMPERLYHEGFQCIRRIKEDGNYYYFIKNTSPEPFDGWIPLNADFASAALYDLMVGANGYAFVRDNQGTKEIYIQAKAGESLVVETFKGKYKGDFFPYYEESGEPFVISGPWYIEFLSGGPSLPASIMMDELQSWTVYGPEYAAFSGTAQYMTKIPALPTKAEAWLLDLGDVHDHATVYINGENMGTLIHEPYRIEITGELLNGDNELRVDISNSMANRIINLDKSGAEWKIFYNTNFNARRKANAGADGKFTAVHWEPKYSGFTGPVVLTPLSRIK